MVRLRTRVAFGAVFAVVVAGGQGVAALGASPAAPSPSPGRAQSVAAEQSRAAASGRALGLDTGEKLVVKDVITDPDGTTNVRYNRTFGGLRVIGGDFVSHRTRSGKSKGVSWNGSPKVAVASTTPKVSVASARVVGSRKASVVQETSVATKGELVVYSGGASVKAAPKLAYDVLTVGVRADQTPSRLHTIVDANTGATIASWDEIVNGTGSGLYVGSVGIGTTAGPPWTMRDTAGNNTTDLNGSTSGTGTTFTDTDNIWGNGTVGNRASAGVDAHYGAEKTFDYFNVLGRNGIWDTGVGARSRVHYGTNYVNAFWDGTQMTYGDGAGNAHPLTEVDVAAHEMTHGVTENTSGLVYAGESGGLNEATSDIFGTAVEFYANNTADTPDYLIGELININNNGTPLRYMDKPSKDGASRDCWFSTLGNLDVHYSSGPLNHWFYLASEGSGAKVINGVSYNSPTCNSSTVAPIGRDKAERIWFRTLTTYLTSGSNYAAARDGAIRSAKELYGDTSLECTNVAAAFSAIAVPAGAVSCGSTPPPPSGGNLLGNSGFESGDTLWSAMPNVIGQWGASQPTHSGTWNAWLDGYGVTHTDSVSQPVTIPAGSQATLTFYVHIATAEQPDQAYDTLEVRAGSTILQTLSNQDAAAGYQLKTIDLSAYAGQTITLSFTGVEDPGLATSFVLDDTSLVTSSSSTAPGAPTVVSAVPGNASAVVSWGAPVSNGGSLVTGYTVTASPGGATATTAGATSATVTGLTNGTAYTFTVTATNAAGISAASAASAAVTPRTVPGAPTGVTAAGGNAQAGVSWTAPANNGGSLVTGYTVQVINAATTSQVGALRPAAAGATSLTVTGLSNGTAYKLQVRAANVIGSSAYSALSNAVRPAGTAAVTRASDFNRDGFTDLVTRDTAGRLWLYPGNGAGGFKARHKMGNGGWQAMTAIVTPGDVTGDGRADVLARDALGRMWVYPGNGASGLSARRRIGSGWRGYTITNAANMNGAGRPDLLARDSAGVLWLYPLSGNGVFGRRSKVGSGWNGYTIQGPGDVSGDRRADILARDTSGRLWLYRGNGKGGVVARTLVSSGWKAMTALVTPGNWDRATGNDLLTRDAAGRLWSYPGNNAGGLGAPRQIGSGWKGMTYIG